MSIRSAIAKGDVIRSSFPAHEHMPLYLGSGSAGGSFDGWGLMNSHACGLYDDEGPGRDAPYIRYWEHYSRGKYGFDCWQGVFRVAFDKVPEGEVSDYTQHQALYQGRLKTAYTLANGTKVCIEVYFNPYVRNVMAVEYSYEGDAPGLCLLPQILCRDWYSTEPIVQTCTAAADGYVIDSGSARTQLVVRTISEAGSAQATYSDEGVFFTFPEGQGKHMLLIGMGKEENADAVRDQLAQVASIAAWRSACEDAWARRYGDSWVNIPDEYAQKIFARSLYYLLCSFAAGDYGMPAPMGWSGKGWPFAFPQDVSYSHPALLRLGHVDICKAVVETFARTAEDMRTITNQVYGPGGIMWPWEYPIGPGADMLKDGTPNRTQFEIHNAAYPARMAYETALQLRDEKWTQEVARPVVEASAQFFAAHMFKEESGHWSLQVTPSMSQDEFAQPNEKNYLCALYSARYTFTIAGKMGIEGYEKYLEDGLSFDRLLDTERNLYKTSEDMDPAHWGLAKHPVQLCPLTYLPMAELNDAERNAYARRYDICSDMKKKIVHGWTLEAFCVADVNMGQGEELYQDLQIAKTDTYSDPEQIMFYETSGATNAAFFVTGHGFMLQAILGAFVNDGRGETVIKGAVPKAWEGAEYFNLYTKDGVAHSGRC